MTFLKVQLSRTSGSEGLAVVLLVAAMTSACKTDGASSEAQTKNVASPEPPASSAAGAPTTPVATSQPAVAPSPPPQQEVREGATASRRVKRAGAFRSWGRKLSFPDAIPQSARRRLGVSDDDSLILGRAGSKLWSQRNWDDGSVEVLRFEVVDGQLKDGEQLMFQLGYLEYVSKEEVARVSAPGEGWDPTRSVGRRDGFGMETFVESWIWDTDQAASRW